MSREIPLRANAPHQDFSVNLGDYSLEFEFHWVNRFGYFRVNISDVTSGRVLLTNGRIAHPNVNLLNGLDDKYGRVFMSGPPATLENVGTRAKLMWEPASE